MKRRSRLIKQLLVMTMSVVVGMSLFSMSSYANEGHEHTEECYAKEGDLLCTVPESEGHIHGDDCYTEQSNLICDLEENGEHTHSEECYETQKILTCMQEESEGHVHDEDCYAKGGELICEEEEVELLSNTSEVNDFTSLKEAIANAKENEVTEITITNDIECLEILVISQGKNIVFKTKDAITFQSTDTLNKLSMVQVDEGAAFSLNGNITFDGSSALGYVNCNGTFIMENGVLTGCNISTSTNGLGGVTVVGENASFTLNGGSIENTISQYAFHAAAYVKDGAKFIMNGGSIKDNSFSNQFCGAVVVDNAYFEMNGGEISNNKTKTNQIQSAGGVLVLGLQSYATKSNAKSSSFVMNGGKISGNTSFRGGGVYVMGGAVHYTDFYSKAYFTMNGGEISNNKTHNSGTLTSAGGGIYVEWAGEVTMNGGSIANNSTDGMGGGVATADAWTNYFGTKPYSAAGFTQYNGLYYRNWDKIFPASFTMNGGSITGNTAMTRDVIGDQGCGGGIYISSNNVVLNAGDISNNQSGKQGGGVYVGSVPYVVTLGNALITENSASIIGGGIWVCPTGTVDISVNNGSALYNNSAEDAGDDYAAVHTISKNYETTIADRMLGGGLANWYQDGAIDTSSILGFADDSVSRYNADSDKNVSVSNITSSKEGYALKSVPSKESIDSAKALTTLTITGNTSTRGGGIGSNGGITVGDTFDQTRDLTINKEWIGSDNLPDSITIWVLVNGIRTEKKVLTKEDNWTVSVTGLPVGDDISITVEEEQIDNWKPTYDYVAADNGNITATVTNTFEEKETEKTSVSVKKQWKGDKDSTRPTSVSVQLYKDGKAYGKTVKLSNKNNWTYEWNDLVASSTWSVDEVKVPKGYQKNVTHIDNAYTITNTYTDTPSTGVDSNQNMWTMISILSCIVFLVVILLRKKSMIEYK